VNRIRWAALAGAALAGLSCGDSRPGTSPLGPDGSPFDLVIAGGDGQEVLSGRRSELPFSVRVTDQAGDPVPDRIVEFELTGEAGGILSQPRAITDSDGRAETFLLESRPGPGTLMARVPGTPQAGTLSVEFTFEVVRAPGEIIFDEGTGEVGLPGFPHPDSVVAVTLLDTEGDPLEGVEIWFAAQGYLSIYVDTTDVDGRVETRLRRTNLSVGSGSVFAFILGMSELTTQIKRPVARPAERVIMVSVDGLRADALERLNPPALSRMVTEGAHTVQARTVTPSLTVPAHLSLLSGVTPPEHGVYQDVVELTEDMVDLEPLFRFARKRGRTAVAFMAGEGPLEGFEDALGCKQAFGLDSLQLVDPTAPAVMEAAMEATLDPSNELVFLHFPDPDLAGHAHGWNSPEYDEAVLGVDRQLEILMEALAPVRDSVLVMVTSDHGGGGAYGQFLHGSPSPEDTTIPIFLWGARALAGADLGEASIVDLAPTALWALGIRPPNHYEGEVLLRGFR
jgi:hypothetical protein